MSSAVTLSPVKRPMCARCARPQRVCVCAQLPELRTQNTNVVLLQHPRESHTGIGTAKLAHLSLPGSLLKAGLDFSADSQVQAEVRKAPAYVLFPGPQAIAIADLPTDKAITLIVVDGTWWQAKKLIKLNPWLEQLPRVSFSPTTPSDYRIRRQPAAHCVSTIEALAEVLCQREPAGMAFDHLRDPFRAMVDHQIRLKEEIFSSRHRKRLRPRDKKQPTLPERLQSVWARLVFVQGEANAWPARSPNRPPPEIVHFVAQRASGHETFEAVVAPRRALAPSTCRYVDLDEARLNQGEAIADATQRWRQWLRPDDILCAWGPYHLGVAEADGWQMGTALIDMRNALSQHLKQRLSLVEDAVKFVGLEALPPTSPGRAHRRLTALMQLTLRLHEAT
ncbi:MAG: DTW domain-containing protein [Deltaproteobacteria bacterium]|nr:DTW domain-containing protein [Deltaproteobacteria bacterium]